MDAVIKENLGKGIEAHQAGNLQEADKYYTAILQAQPNHPDANHNMGVLAVRVGKVDQSLPFFQKALEADHTVQQFWISLIDALIQLKRHQDARSLLKQAQEKGHKGDIFDKLEKKLNGALSNKINLKDVDNFIEMIKKSSKPIFYTGGGVINSGPKASELLRDLVSLTGFPITSTLQGLGAFPGEDPQFLGMLGMHGTYEANNAMHDCDLMINIGARFDDRITGKIDEFSPKSKKIHIDIDPSSIGKNVKVDLAITSDVTELLQAVIKRFKERNKNFIESNKQKTAKWWSQIDKWREKKSLNFINSKETIKPQHAVQRLYELTKHQDTFITTEVGQHQMWAAQHYKFNKPNRWMTSGGLGTMGYGLPAAIGVQIAHPKKLVVDIAGEASILMNIQEMSTAIQYRLPVKIFILNNEYMGMVRQWQELLHDKNYSESYTEALPDFVKLAEAYGAVGIRAKTPDELDEKIKEMINTDKPVIFDCVVDKVENCYPMIPSGKPHNQMLPGPEDEKEEVSDEGKTLV